MGPRTRPSVPVAAAAVSIFLLSRAYLPASCNLLTPIQPKTITTSKRAAPPPAPGRAAWEPDPAIFRPTVS
jgi:hypothetical protein